MCLPKGQVTCRPAFSGSAVCAHFQLDRDPIRDGENLRAQEHSNLQLAYSGFIPVKLQSNPHQKTNPDLRGQVWSPRTPTLPYRRPGSPAILIALHRQMPPNAEALDMGVRRKLLARGIAVLGLSWGVCTPCIIESGTR